MSLQKEFIRDGKRRIIGSVTPPEVVPSHPSIGWIAQRLPMVRPRQIVFCSRGEASPWMMVSSSWRSRLRLFRCARKTAPAPAIRRARSAAA